MPDFEIHGKGIKTGRKRKRTYTANSIEEAKAMALKDDTDPVEIIELTATNPTSKPVAKKKTTPAKKSAKKASTAKKTVKKSTTTTNKVAPAPTAKKAAATASKPSSGENKKSPQVQKKPTKMAQLEASNSPHWTKLPKSIIKTPNKIADSSDAYLLLMVALLFFIIFYYFGLI